MSNPMQRDAIILVSINVFSDVKTEIDVCKINRHNLLKRND